MTRSTYAVALNERRQPVIGLETFAHNVACYEAANKKNAKILLRNALFRAKMLFFLEGHGSSFGHSPASRH